MVKFFILVNLKSAKSFGMHCVLRMKLRIMGLNALPGVKSRFENKEIEDEAKKRLEFIVEYWIKNARLEIKGDGNEKK